MPDEFFSASVARAVRALPTENPNCGRCGLYRTCRSPKMKVSGQGKKRVLIVSEFPGMAEDHEGQALVGRTGQFLESELKRLGFDMRRDAWLTNALICFDSQKVRPPHAVDDCRPNLLKTIRDLDPVVIVLMGGLAISSLIGHVWKSDVGAVARWVGRTIPNHKPNAWLVPTNNPAALLKEKADPALTLQFRRGLEDVVRLAEEGTRPWPDGPPDYRSMVERVHSPQEAAQRLSKYTGGTIAFDYEATTIKPDGPHAEIVCCSVCWEGEETIAFPWHGAAVEAMKRLLLDPRVGKICANMKYEHRYSMGVLGVEVVNLVFDTMLAAHVIDPRPSGATGLKFQAFCRLGAPDYSSHLDDFLKGTEAGGKKAGNAKNRVRDIDLDQLLLYCGIDSLLEYKLAQIQMRELGIA